MKNKFDFKFITIFIVVVGIMIWLNIDTNQNVKYKNDEETKAISTTQLLEKLKGDWGRCEKEYDCSGLLIAKDGHNYTLLSYIMWSEVGMPGTINNVTKVSEYVYKLKIHFDEYSDDFISYDAFDSDLEIDIRNIDKDIICIDSKEYKKILDDDREVFFDNYFE